jgi:hypothetical protein
VFAPLTALVCAHACLAYSQDGGPAEWPLTGVTSLQMHGTCRVNNSVLLRELLLAGLGVTLTRTSLSLT